MNDPIDPTDAHMCSDGHLRSGVGGLNSYDAQSDSASHGGGGVVGPIHQDAQPRTDSHPTNGVLGSTPTEPPNAVTSAKRDPAAQSAPTPPDTPRSPASATAHTACPEGSAPPAAPNQHSTANSEPESLVDPFLALSADVLDDLETVRVANENRLRQLTRRGPDEDGVERGFGLDESHRDVARLAALVEALSASEHQATLNLNRHMRGHLLGAWVARTPGVGEKQAARLLAAIGDPARNETDGTWRSLRQLYSYSGYGDATKQVKRRGERASWDPNAKMRAHLVAVSCIKTAHSPYRAVYDEGRARYADAVHPGECKRCAPAGSPAQPGTSLSAGHQHARALRLVAKRILRDLWREARRLHGFPDEDDDGTTGGDQ